MKKLYLILAVGVISIFSISSCTKDELADPNIPHEEELITTLNFTLTPDGGGTTVVLSFQDLDGDGGNPPIITDGTLETGTTYFGSIELLNELENPADDITTEIQDEAEDHQFFYIATTNDVSISYDDMDANGNPIGLLTKVNTGATGTGTLTVILRHQPDKYATGVSGGDITNAGGETDIEVTFNVDVQ